MTDMRNLLRLFTTKTVKSLYALFIFIHKNYPYACIFCRSPPTKNYYTFLSVKINRRCESLLSHLLH